MSNWLTKEGRALAERWGLPKAAVPFLRPDDNYSRQRVRGQRGSYPYIPLNTLEVEFILKVGIEQFKRRRRRKPATFLEVGCGFGAVTHYAQTKLGLVATGFDIVPEYVALSRRFCEGTFIEADALTFSDYGEYDLIYFYQPFYDNLLRKQFCAKVARDAKGLVLPCYALEGTPLAFDWPERYGRRWIAGCWPFAAPNCDAMFAPFDGATKQIIYGGKKQFKESQRGKWD